MSYDLMVFEPEAAPKDHDASMECYLNLTKWNDGPYDDPARTSARLRAWVQEMRRMFPDMNTPEAEIHLQDDDGVLSDYTIGRQFVYAGFAWSKAVAAAGEAERLAKRLDICSENSVGRKLERFQKPFGLCGFEDP
jgi:hypothetical protein